MLVAIFSLVQKQKLRSQLDKIEEEKAAFSKDSILKRSLFQIDSLLKTGQYKFALDAYKEQFSTIQNDDKENVKFRIEIAQQFMNLHEETSKKNALEDSVQAIDTNDIKKRSS